MRFGTVIDDYRPYVMNIKIFSYSFWVLIIGVILNCTAVVNTTISYPAINPNHFNHGQVLRTMQNNSLQPLSTENYDFRDNLAGGLKTTTEIQGEIQALLQDSEIANKESLHIPRPLLLSMVIFHHENND